MPHDMNGNVLKAGDAVVVPCTVKEIQTGEEYCNVTLETNFVLYPGDARTSIVLNARQVALNKHESPEL